MEPKIDPAAAWATIFAYADVEATTLEGKALSVRVRQVRARQAFSVLGIIEDEFALLEFVCISTDGSELPAGWVDLLTPESHGKLVEKARELNFPVVLGALNRSMGVVEKLGTMGPAMAKANALKSSLTSVPSA